MFDNKSSATLHLCSRLNLGGKPIVDDNVIAAKAAKKLNQLRSKNTNWCFIGSNWLNDKRDTANTTFKKNIHVMSVSIKERPIQ